MLEHIVILGLAATGLALILRKLLSGWDLPDLFRRGLTCDVCSGWWATLVVCVISGRFSPVGILASTAISAVLLRVFARIDPGPVIYLNADDDDEDLSDLCAHGESMTQPCPECRRTQN